jgi:hypothetical protein
VSPLRLAKKLGEVFGLRPAAALGNSNPFSVQLESRRVALRPFGDDIASDPRLLARAQEMDLRLELERKQSGGTRGMPYGARRIEAVGNAIRKEIGSQLDNSEPPSPEEMSETVQEMARARHQGLDGVEARAAFGQRPVRDPVASLPPLPPIKPPPKRMRTIHSAQYGTREVEVEDE